MANSSDIGIEALRFSFNGPIRTNINLDTRLLLSDHALNVADELKNSLIALHPNWYFFSRPTGAFEINVDTRRERIVKPAFIAATRFSDDELEGFQNLIFATGVGQMGVLNQNLARIESVSLRFYHFGYASFWMEVSVPQCPDGVTLGLVREEVERLSREEVIRRFQEPFDERVDQFRRAVMGIEGRSDFNFVKGFNETTPAAVPRWVHRTYCLNFETRENLENAQQYIEDLIYTSSGSDLEDAFPRPDMSIYVASGNSAMLSVGTESIDAWRNLNEVVEFQNSYFAKADDLDEQLMRLINQISLDKERASGSRRAMKDIDAHAVEIVDSREEVLIFRNDVDDYEGHLDPDARKIWSGLWSQWETGKKFDHIEKQVDIMGGLYDRIVTLLNQNQTNRLNSLVLVFTLLSGVSVVVDTCSFTQQTPLSPTSFAFSNTVLVLIMIALLALVFWLLTRR